MAPVALGLFGWLAPWLFWPLSWPGPMKKPAVEADLMVVDPGQVRGEGEGVDDGGRAVADVEVAVRIDLVRTTVPQSR